MSAIEERLGFFVEHGWLERVPSAWQVRVGWMAMLPITLGESSRERERSRLNWMAKIPTRVGFQVLYEPRQLLPDTGLGQRPEQIVGHLLSVYHEDAFLGYDLQLLHSHEGGLALLRERAAEVVSSTSRWSPYLRQLVSWPGYHERLMALATKAESFEYPDPEDLDPRFVSLVGFARWCAELPDWSPLAFYR